MAGPWCTLTATSGRWLGPTRTRPFSPPSATRSRSWTRAAAAWPARSGSTPTTSRCPAPSGRTCGCPRCEPPSAMATAAGPARRGRFQLSHPARAPRSRAAPPGHDHPCARPVPSNRSHRAELGVSHRPRRAPALPQPPLHDYRRKRDFAATPEPVRAPSEGRRTTTGMATDGSSSNTRRAVCTTTFGWRRTAYLFPGPCRRALLMTRA